MAKPRLVYSKLLTLNSNWLQELVAEYFELVPLEPGRRYQQSDCFYVAALDNQAAAWRDAGHKVIVDNLWEIPVAAPGCYVLEHPAWFWYQESLWYRYLGYHQYVPRPRDHYLALMPMRLQKPPRDYVVELLGETLDQFIWSYQARGRNLPDDQDPRDWNSQRYFNPEWYNQSRFSVVLESAVAAPRPFVTEKTFKPLAFQHPFLVVGCPGTLRYLRELGFETWDNIWDESYDNIDNWRQRCYNVVQEIHNYFPSDHSAITLEKIKHNHAHFFDQALVNKLIRQNVLDPLLNYAEAR